MVPIEAVVRGYLAGSGWKEYREHGTVCGIRLPRGLRETDRLPEPIFTPATKAEQGEHDENIDFDTMVAHIGRDAGVRSRDCAADRRGDPRRSIALYRYAAAVARASGILLADTKFEFGFGMEADRDDREPGRAVGPAAEQIERRTRPSTGRRPDDGNGRRSRTG